MPKQQKKIVRPQQAEQGIAEEIKVELRPILQEPYQPRTYANWVFVSHTEYDFGIDFAEQQSPPQVVEEEDKTKFVGLPIRARIVIPTVVVPGLIKALQIQLEKFNTEQEAKKEDARKSE